MDYLSSVPLELYIETLYLVPPENILSVCSTNRYALNLCNETFFHNYINKNYSGYGVWTMQDLQNANVKTWKELLNILINGITIRAEALLFEETEIVDEIAFDVTVKIDDTAEMLTEKIAKKINSEGYYPMTLSINFVSKFEQNIFVLNIGKGLKDYPLKFSLSSLTHMPQNIPKSLPTKERFFDRQFSTNTQIGENKSFYFNLSKIWVHVLVGY
jgi:hypothetical protein